MNANKKGARDESGAREENSPDRQHDKESGDNKQACSRLLLELFYRLELSAFNHRQRACLNFIRRQSWDRGQIERPVYVADLTLFMDGTDLQRADVSRALDELEANFVIEAPKKRRGRGGHVCRPAGYYGIILPFERWRIVPAKELPRILQLVPLELDLNSALRATVFEEFAAQVASGSAGREAFPAVQSGDLEIGRDDHADQSPGTATEPISPSGGRVATKAAQDWDSQIPAPPLLAEDIGGVPIPAPEEKPRNSGCFKNNQKSPGIPVVLKTTKKSPENPVVLKTTKKSPENPVVLKTTKEKGFSPLQPPFPKERLNAERLTFNAQRLNASEADEEREFREGQERARMEMLSDWIGAEEMETRGAMFRVYAVRPYGVIVERLIAEGKSLEAVNDPNRPRNRAAWLIHFLCLHTRHKSWRHLMRAVR